VGGDSVLLCLNMWKEPVPCTLPKAAAGRRWLRILDTASWAEPYGNFWPPEQRAVLEGIYSVHPMSIVAFEEAVPN